MQTEHASFRRIHARWLVALVGCAAGVLGTGGCYDQSGYELDQPSGATSSRGGSRSSGAGSAQGGSSDRAGGGGTSSQAGSIGSGGEEPGQPGPSYPEPSIESMEPASGAYGTLVTIRGQGLGNPALGGFTLALGNQGEVELTPQDKVAVQSWTDEEIVFRFPFPAEGAVSLEAPKGAALAGEFTPTWHVAREIDKAPAATALASISPEPDHIVMLFDTMPLKLLDVSRDGVLERSVTAPGVDPSSIRLYLNEAGETEGVGVSSGADPVLVHLRNQAGDLVAAPTAIELLATDFSVAGGSEGASVWMKRADGWHRARPSAGSWQLDKGPIVDPNPSARMRRGGGASDGSLFLAHAVDTGNFFDDMEAPYMMRLAPAATQFGPATAAGRSVDDYITGLTLTSSGDGLVVRTCGSDVDPFGLSGTTRYCYDALHAPSGARLLGVPVASGAIVHAFTHERAVAGYCSRDRSWLIQTDTDTEVMPGAPLGEPVLFPCPEAVALEVNGDGDYLPVVRLAGKTYLLERNPALLAPIED